MRKILLDTNAYAAYKRGDERVLEQLSEADRVFVPLFVLGELYYGFKGGKRERENRRELGEFLKKPAIRIPSPTEETAELFAYLKEGLKRKGKPIPTNDVWIAATCFEWGATLLAYDRHFTHIDGLRLWNS